jgi:hypothetical protein
MTCELEGRHVILSARDETSGAMVTIVLSRPASETLSMALRSVVKIQDPQPFDFCFRGELKTA